MACLGYRVCRCVSKEQKASAAGLEPATPRSEVWCASDCAMRPSSSVRWSVWIEEKKRVSQCRSGRITKREKDGSNEFRTHDLKIMRLTLYLLSYTPFTLLVMCGRTCRKSKRRCGRKRSQRELNPRLLITQANMRAKLLCEP